MSEFGFGHRQPPWARDMEARLDQKFQQILDAVQTQKKEMDTIMLDLTALTTAVTNEETVEQSAITLMNGLTAQLQTLIANSGNTVDPAALQAIVDQINTNKTGLAAAVVANTPATPAGS